MARYARLLFVALLVSFAASTVAACADSTGPVRDQCTEGQNSNTCH